MGMASIFGRARVNPENPRAAGVCDRCGFVYSHSDLQWEREWRGVAILKTGFLVCGRCLDRPNEQLKSRLMPPDPVPIRNPRPELHVYPFDVSGLAVEAAVPQTAMTIEAGIGNLPPSAVMEIEP